jgi:nicotinate-nucleotide adenylyltransferase
MGLMTESSQGDAGPGKQPTTGKRRAIGILGGTFDPVHVGHLALAEEARRALDLERVLFVPNARPPHKRDQIVTAADHREAMVRLAIAGEPGFELSRIELDRAGPSYALDTVTEVAVLSRAEGRPEPWLIISAEALADLPSWREPLEILARCRIAVAPRPGSEAVDQDWVAERFPEHQERFTFLTGPKLDIASTTIRDRVAAGSPIGGLVPAAVERYIDETGLYRGKMSAGGIAEGASSVDNDQGGVTGEAAIETGADPRRARRPGLPARRSEAAPESPLGAEIGPVDEETLALAHRIVELASDKKASDIVLLDVRGQTTMTDYFVICSGASDRQLGAISDGIVEGAKAGGTSPLSREGEASSHWVLIDFGGVIVHVMSVPEREFYQLERLWSRSSLLLHVV